MPLTKRGCIDHPWGCEKWAPIRSFVITTTLSRSLPDSGRQSNVGMLALGDGSPIGGGWGTIHGSCVVASSMIAGKSTVDSWPTVGTAGGGSATTSSLPSVAGRTDGSTFVCWITG